MSEKTSEKMSETFIRILLAELNIIRIKCESCHAVSEMDVTKLGPRFANGQCPHCNSSWFDPQHHGTTAFGQLAKGLMMLEQMTDRVSIEFVIPDPESKA